MNWYKEVISGETHTLVPAPVQYTTPDGRRIGNFNQSTALMTQCGWREWTEAELEAWHAQYDPPIPERQRCTRYQLINCLENHFPALLSSFREIYDSDTENGRNLRFFWDSVNDLDRNDTKFKSAISALGITDDQVSEIFSKITGIEPIATD